MLTRTYLLNEIYPIKFANYNFNALKSSYYLHLLKFRMYYCDYLKSEKRGSISELVSLYFGETLFDIL